MAGIIHWEVEMPAICQQWVIKPKSSTETILVLTNVKRKRITFKS